MKVVDLMQFYDASYKNKYFPHIGIILRNHFQFFIHGVLATDCIVQLILDSTECMNV